ncbi:MAG: bifunctional hydroxymethylpyrimidine kinase/phosphomethylpyrimidine kinase [Candidatus Eremiobacteraeota bacterium]|nr:bifunctional hydroxymethylpyrimidine kinase/phosphomethylpyrimidine kinase [Candidatus Eremiobacteraeota bacterium]
MSKAVLSIGTTHPWNIAGVGLDACVVREHGMRPLTVIAAVSAQDAAGVHAVHAIPTEVLVAELDAIPDVAAVRVGAVGDEWNARAVTWWLERRAVPVVIDPVMNATLGGRLADTATIAALLPAASRAGAVLTPNAEEASILTGTTIASVGDMHTAAEDLRSRGIRNVLIKGHLTATDDVVDVLAYAQGVKEFHGRRLPQSMRGTGCTIAAALACALAADYEIVEAVERARRYVRAKIAAQTTFENLNVAF